MKIPLFDIDGTLFSTTKKKFHDDAFEFAFRKVYGVNAKKNDSVGKGRMDIQIIVEVLRLYELTEKEIKKKIKLATKAMAEYAIDHKNEVNPEILPGVIELLKKLKRKNIPLGILTGNIETIGWLKLEKSGLKDFFDFGAFGDKAYKRSDLVEIARRNAEKNLARKVRTEELIIIGDTPRDIQCAKDAGIKSIAVSTGIFPFEELVDEKPDLAVHSLEEKSVLEFIKS